ncbi:MAG: Ig-like domain-containing protein, partial [Treponemataceae bacterium]
MKRFFSILMSILLILFMSCEQSDVRIDVSDVKITNIKEAEGNSPSLYLRTRKTYPLDFQLFPQNASDAIIRWESTDPLIAQIRPTGTIITMSVGEVIISAYNGSGRLLKSFKVHVLDDNIVIEQEIFIRYNGAIVGMDKALQLQKDVGNHALTATIEPSNTSSLSKTISWKSSNPETVDISVNGDLEIKTVGTAVITAMADGLPNAQVGLSITDETPVENIEIKVQNARTKQEYVFPVDEPIQLEAVFTPSNAVSRVYWRSSNIQAAIISQEGVVTAKEAGKRVLITAQSENGGKTTSIEIKTVAPRLVTGVEVVPSKVLLYVGETLKTSTITVSVKPDSAQNKGIEWISEDALMVRADSQKIEALQKGTTKVKVTSQENRDVFGELEVEVLDGSRGITIKREADFDFLNIDTKRQLEVSFKDPRITNKEINWHSSDRGIAIVDDKGVLQTLQRAGKTEITATSKADPSLVDKIEVQVAILPSRIMLSSKAIVIDGISKSVELTATVYPVNCSSPIEWSTSEKNVVSARNTRKTSRLGESIAMLLSLKNGEEIVTASVKGANGVTVSSTCAVTVDGIREINVAPITGINVGDLRDFTITTVPAGRGDRVTVSVDNDQVLTVVDKGNGTHTILAYSGSMTNITFSADDISTKLPVTVNGPLYSDHRNASELHIVGIGTLKDATSLSIPAFVQGIPVTTINDTALADSKFTSVTIGSNVKKIGSSAFASSVANSGSITSVTFASNRTVDLEIKDSAFKNQKLSTITIPVEVKVIGTNAFEGNTDLKNVYLDSNHIANVAHNDSLLFSNPKVIYVKDDISAAKDSYVATNFPYPKAKIGAYLPYSKIVDRIIAPDSITVESGSSREVTITTDPSGGEDDVDISFEEGDIVLVEKMGGGKYLVKGFSSGKATIVFSMEDIKGKTNVTGTGL